ncbi:MAG: winged helix-turn-helix transcriptional regulator [Chlorobiaceae bacterium]|nr:winged helix-turn-helix transcriptional regulator [Chlorobiaceae bacterium]
MKTVDHKNVDGCLEECSHPDIVEKMRSGLPGEELLEGLTQLFKVLGDHTRIRILSVLYHAELCVCDLTSILGMNQSAVSHQLRVLRDAKIVKSRKKGKNVLYSLDDAHVSGLITMASEHVLE